LPDHAEGPAGAGSRPLSREQFEADGNQRKTKLSYEARAGSLTNALNELAAAPPAEDADATR